MDKILYFPTISIPKSQWLMSSMFYWDKVGSIVPLEFLQEPSQLGKDMRKLVELELVEQVVPEMYLSDIPSFEKDFLDFVDSSIQYRPITKNNKLILRENEKLVATNEIHMGKLRNLGYKLERKGLALKGEGSWYTVESSTASYFMTYLATILGQITDYTPLTSSYDELANFLPNHEIVNTKEALKEKLRAKIIEGILPFPNFVEDPYDIVRFKEKHNDQLRNFRKFIEKFILDLEGFEDNQIEERIKLFIEGSQDEINDISDKMGFFKWDNLNFSTLCAVSSSAIVTGTGIQDSSYSNIAAGTLGLLGALDSVRNKNWNAAAERRPLAYASIIKRNFDVDRRIQGD